MMRRLNKKGFTLVEIMIVVAIIGLLAAIAIPNFVRARVMARTNACVANLKQIDGAKQIWAIDTGAADTVIPGGSEAAAMGTLVPDYLKRTPVCQSGGTYTIGTVQVEPSCSVHGVASAPTEA
ncbi:MAG: type II secretion system protein [Candidatus Omnitrophota bacterium]